VQLPVVRLDRNDFTCHECEVTKWGGCGLLGAENSSTRYQKPRICGDIHGSKLGIFRFSSCKALLLSFGLQISAMSSLSLLSQVNILTCSSCSTSADKFRYLGRWRQRRGVDQYFQLKRPVGQEKNYIFMGDFVDRGQKETCSTIGDEHPLPNVFEIAVSLNFNR
jgi:hypothetical protein